MRVGFRRLLTPPNEEDMKRLARRSIVAIENIRRGESFSLENIGLRRPGTGLAPSWYEQVLTTKATRHLAKGDLIQLGDFS